MGQVQREQLSALLKQALGNDNTYFKKPPSTGMSYPCIIYDRDDVSTLHADNKPYHNAQRYQVTLISKDPDEPAYDRVLAMPYCAFSRSFPTSDLHHDVFVIYH